MTGSVRQKQKKRIKWIIKLFAVLILAVFAAGICLNIYICESVEDPILKPEEVYGIDADCILILGAGVRPDGSPSNMLEDRLITGINLYENGGSQKLLMSGDHGRVEYDEVNCMKSYAAERGVPVEDIFMDHAGFSTYESMYRARDVFGAERIIVVTQEYHLYRALYVARALGLNAVGVGADIRTYSGQGLRDTREIAARLKDFAYTIIKPEPKYLGEAISLDGSGEVTNG